MEINREIVLQSFLAETEEGLNQTEQNLVALEASPSDRELLQSIFRTIHTIKGNASLLEFNQLAGSVHTVEDLLDLLRSGAASASPKLINVLLQAVDALRGWVPAAVAGRAEPKSAHAAVFARMAKEISKVRKSGGESPASEPRTAREPAASAPDTVRKASARSLRVDVEKLDRMLNLTGEIAIAQGRLRRMLEDLSASGNAAALDALETHQALDGLYLDLQEVVKKVRMVPVGPTFHRFSRTVRDLAQKHGKLARIVVEGEDVELDTTVLEHIQDPLTHMIRNAVDHGLELPDARRAKGKNPSGQITLRAFHASANIVIQVSDDGAGLNLKHIAGRARELGLITEEHQPSEQEIQNLVFQSGFSTAEKVSDLSGRGIGLDVVRRNVTALRGSIGVESREGVGTTITIRLPLTLAIIEGFCVKAGHETYVIPLESVVECLELPQEHHRYEEGGVINLRGVPLPYVQLRSLFGVEGRPPEREKVVVIESQGGRAGLAVDELIGEHQTVIKPLGHIFQAITGVAGSTILGNGRVALILDVAALIRDAVARAEGRFESAEEEDLEAATLVGVPQGSIPNPAVEGA